MFICKICGSEVKPGQPYCHKCGADVAENYVTVCPSCNSNNVAGSRYCSTCGGILSVISKPVCPVCGAKNMPGSQFCISCGAPIIGNRETHSENDILDARKIKLRLDNMERDRLAKVDEEVARRMSAAEDGIKAKEDAFNQEVAQKESEIARTEEVLNSYKEMIDTVNADDIQTLKKVSAALHEYTEYYADPYSSIEDQLSEEERFVCPACGGINPANVVSCMNCGRSKARSLSLLSRGLIKQHEPVKRQKTIIDAPVADLEIDSVPTVQEFIDRLNKKEEVVEQPVVKEVAEVKEEPVKEEPKQEAPIPQAPPVPPMPPQYPPYGGYPYAPYGYGAPYQMAPIVQPVAFVPYVTQEQPLVQYSPDNNQSK